MSKKDKYLVGLDIGSTKTCALLAEVDNEQLRFLALGAAESKSGNTAGSVYESETDPHSVGR